LAHCAFASLFASKLKEYENMAKKDITQTIKDAASKAPGKVTAAVKSAVDIASEQHKRISEWTKPQKRTFVLFAILMFVVMIIFAVFVFFLTLKGEERTMVPDVRRMDLADALVKMQERELYPRLTLRFTDNPLDRNLVLDQSPPPGSIVKAGRRINLVVSRGAVLDKIEDYRGRNIDDLRLYLQGLSTTAKGLLSIREPPLYMFDTSAPGTILDQNPKPGTEISGPTILDLVVSKGPEAKDIAMPSLLGLTMDEAASRAATIPLIFSYKMRAAHNKEVPGTVVEQSEPADKNLKQFDRVQITIAAPAARKGYTAGVFEYTLPEYPYAVPVSLDAIAPNGTRTTLYSVKHPGGAFSAPFSVQNGSVLVLMVSGAEVTRKEVK
jgi:beta-lactam-binding protein with PASTA domain